VLEVTSQSSPEAYPGTLNGDEVASGDEENETCNERGLRFQIHRERKKMEQK